MFNSNRAAKVSLAIIVFAILLNIPQMFNNQFVYLDVPNGNQTTLFGTCIYSYLFNVFTEVRLRRMKRLLLVFPLIFFFLRFTCTSTQLCL